MKDAAIKILSDSLITIRQKAMDHPCFDQERFDQRDLDGLAEIGGDICDWTIMAIIADDALKAY